MEAVLHRSFGNPYSFGCKVEGSPQTILFQSTAAATAGHATAVVAGQRAEAPRTEVEPRPACGLRQHRDLHDDVRPRHLVLLLRHREAPKKRHQFALTLVTANFCSLSVMPPVVGGKHL